MFTAGFYLALVWMLEGLEARRLRCGDSIILEGRVFNEIINYHFNLAGVGLFAISYEPSTGTLVPHPSKPPGFLASRPFINFSARVIDSIEVWIKKNTTP